LALSLFFFRGIFIQNLQQIQLPVVTVAKAPKTKAVPQPVPSDSDIHHAMFSEGLVEKIEWTGASDKLQMAFTFRQEIKADQIQITKIRFDDHPRQLIKISDVEGNLGQKNTSVGHALVNQVRMGIHEENGKKNLHIVVDMTSANVSVASTKQDPKKLTIDLQYGSN